tara:strand:- start:597 stop:731 length:135 start_codon:yes stop_codon:yes gene_type:complete
LLEVLVVVLQQEMLVEVVAVVLEVIEHQVMALLLYRLTENQEQY